MNVLRDEIAAIIAVIAEGNDYWHWNHNDHLEELDQEAVVNDIMAAIVEHDEDVLEVYGVV